MERCFRARVSRARIWRHWHPALSLKRENLYHARQPESFPYRSRRPGGHRIAGLLDQTGNIYGRVPGEEVWHRGRCTSVRTTRKWEEREGSKTASRIVGRKKGSRFPAFREQGPPRRDRKSGRMLTRAWREATRFARLPCFPLDPRKGYS